MPENDQVKTTLKARTSKLISSILFFFFFFFFLYDDHTFGDVIVENHILQLALLFPRLHTGVDQILILLLVVFLVAAVHFLFEHLHLYSAYNNILADMASA